MKALILAGGLGTRLRPLTHTRPKHLLPIGNVAHIEHVLELLARHGVDHVVLLTSYLAEQFTDVVDRARGRGMQIDVPIEPEPLGTAGALKNAEPLIGDETFFAFNGDVLTDADLDELLELHRTSRAEATILLTPVQDPSAYGVVPIDATGLVQGFIEKPPPGEAPTNLINAGVYVMEPAVLRRIPPGRPYSAERELFPALVADGSVYARGTRAYWMDIGTPDKYLQANLDALAGRYRSETIAAPADDQVLIGDGAAIDDGAKLAVTCVGPGGIVEAGATVRDSVLLAEARVQQGATVARCVLGAGSVVSRGASLTGVTLADGEVAGG